MVCNWQILPVVFGLLFTVISVAVADEYGPTPAEVFIVPTMGDLMRELDLEKPELAAVKSALDRGDDEAAGEEYVRYFRAKEMPKSPALEDWDTLTPDPAASTEDADSFMAGHIVDGYDAPDGKIDWYNAPALSLTRMYALDAAGLAYRNTGDAKYARFMVDHIFDYMNAYPMEEWIGKEDQGFISDFVVCRPWHWCMVTHNTDRICQSLALLRTSEHVGDDEILEMLYRVYQQARYLRHWMPKWVDMRHNGAVAMIEHMVPIFTVLGDFEDAAEWKAYCDDALGQYIDEAFYPDGAGIELSTPYCAGITHQLMNAAYLLFNSDEAITPVRERLAAVVDFQVGISRPDLRCPSFGDGYGHPLSYTLDARLLPRLDAAYANTVLGIADEPEPDSLVWPRPNQPAWGGYYAMRSAWDKDALYMCIDGGPWGTTHRHGDKLSFELAAYGVNFIIDPTGTYYRSPKPDAYISCQAASFLHNTVTVDGVDEFMYSTVDGERVENGPREVQTPLNDDNLWEHGNHFSIFASRYSFGPVNPAEWVRRVIFVDRKYWLLQDVLTGDEEKHAIEQNFQFDMDMEITFDGEKTIATAPNGAKLVIVPLTGGLAPQVTTGDRTPHVTYWPDGVAKDDWFPGDTLQDVSHGRGWTGRGGHKLMPAPAVTYSGEMQFPAMVTLAIVPLAPAESMDALPEITHEGDVWRLPYEGGELEYAGELWRTWVEDIGE